MSSLEAAGAGLRFGALSSEGSIRSSTDFISGFYFGFEVVSCFFG